MGGGTPRGFTPRQQITSMAGATVLGLLFAGVTTQVAGLGPQSRPPLLFYLPVALIVIVTLGLWFPHFARSLIHSDLAERLIADSDSQGPRENGAGEPRVPVGVGGPAPGRPENGMTYLLLATAAAMILQLGWLTVYTGGAFRSPFAQLLTTTALLAPYIANTRKVGFALGAAAVFAFGLFGWLPTQPESDQATPGWLVFTTTAAATAIALLVSGIAPILVWLRSKVDRYWP